MLRGGVFGLVRAALVAVAAGAGLSGCTSETLDLAALSTPGLRTTGTVAFESIDGPPEAVFRRLVGRLGQEASARRVAMVSREQPAQYRIRGYVAAHVQGPRTTISWVWDVFTDRGERVARLTGEVPGAASERAWEAADDAVIARMAQDGMSRLGAFLAGAPPQDVAASVPAQGAMAYMPIEVNRAAATAPR